jgi:hypothetical protein
MRAERDRAADRSHSHTRTRVQDPGEKTLARPKRI